MKQNNAVHKETQTYFAGQWAEAGVYRCLDPCSPWERIVVLEQDAVLPDPTHGSVARFRRVRGREAERLLAEAGRQARQHRVAETRQPQAKDMTKGGEMAKRPKPK